jgi:hypothetical protein
MTDGGHHLTIVGQSIDSVNLTGGWDMVSHGAEFTTYSGHSGGDTLIVEVSNVMAQTFS